MYFISCRLQEKLKNNEINYTFLYLNNKKSVKIADIFLYRNKNILHSYFWNNENLIKIIDTFSCLNNIFLYLLHEL